jgi:DNA-binding NtrC family response regulator
MNFYAKLKKKKIILMDDDEWVRDSLCIFFETQGCSLKAVRTAEAGMAELRNRPYDITIVDEQLPGANGLDLLTQIRKIFPHMLTILISAYGNHQVHAQACEVGICNIVEKPFNMEKMRASLAHLVG